MQSHWFYYDLVCDAVDGLVCSGCRGLPFVHFAIDCLVLAGLFGSGYFVDFYCDFVVVDFDLEGSLSSWCRHQTRSPKL